MSKRENEDNLLELRIKIERWAKRNKKTLVGIGAAIALWLVAMGAYSVMEDSRVAAASSALNALAVNPADTKALATLEAKSPELYDLVALKAAIEAEDKTKLEELSHKNSIAGTLASYQLATMSNKSSEIASFVSREGAMLKDFALIQEAYLLFVDGKVEEGKRSLQQVSASSDLKPVADALNHYQSN